MTENNNDLDKVLNENADYIKRIQKDIKKLKKDKALQIKKRIQVLREKYPLVYPIVIQYDDTYYTGHMGLSIIHVARTNTEAELFLSKILSKSPSSINSEYIKFCEAINKSNLELKPLERIWNALIVQDKRSDEYKRIQELKNEIEEIKKAQSDGEHKRRRLSEKYPIFLQKKLGVHINGSACRDILYDGKAINSQNISDKMMLQLEVTDPDMLPDLPINSADYNYNDDCVSNRDDEYIKDIHFGISPNNTYI